MSRPKFLQMIIAIPLVILMLVGCSTSVATPVSEAPAATTSTPEPPTDTPEPPTATLTPVPPTVTPTLVPPTATPTLAPPTATPTPESLGLQIGDIFSVEPYQVKLIQVEERPSIIALMSDEIGVVNPKKNENAWLVLTIEITNSGNEVSPLMLLPSSAVILEADGQQTELSSVGVLAPEDSAIMLGFMNEQTITRGFLGTGASGRIFVIPDDDQNLLLAGGTGNIIGDHNGPQWDLGNLPPEKAAQLSLLFEVRAGTSELSWQFLDAVPIGLPESQTGSLPDERGPSFTIGMTASELCQVAEALELKCP